MSFVKPSSPIDEALAPPELPAEPDKTIEGRSTWQLAWARLRRDRAAIGSLIVIVVIIVIALAAPLVATITGHGTNEQFRTTGLSPDGIPYGPNHNFWFGTDGQGRDVLVRIAYGARVSLLIGVLATIMVMIIGAVLGLTAGYLGGWIDTVLARLFDLILSLPYLLIAISLVSVGFLGGQGLPLTVFVIGVFSFASVARVIRGQVLSIKEKEYIEAARSLGASSMRIIFVDILPNVVTQLIIYATLLIPSIILFEAALSFLGLGIPPPTADWGAMISDSQNYIEAGVWWYLLFPSLALVVTTLAFNILGDGVRDALDPRLDRL